MRNLFAWLWVASSTLSKAGWLACAIIIAISKLAIAQPADDLPVILAIGESTTAGYGVPAALSYPAQLQGLLTANGYNYRVVNFGRSGITTAMALSDLDRGLRLGPRIVLIALGGNDQGNQFAATRTKENLRKMVALYVRTGAQVFWRIATCLQTELLPRRPHHCSQNLLLKKARYLCPLYVQVWQAMQIY